MRVLDLRLLIGPNIYFPFPAVKLALDAGESLMASDPSLPTLQGRLTGLLCVEPAELAPSVDDRPKATLHEFLKAVIRTLHTGAGLAAPPIDTFDAHDPSEVVVAYGWTRPEAALELGRQAARCVQAATTGDGWRLQDAIREIQNAPERTVNVAIPDSERRAPLIAVTGTNGKTTVCRLCAHILAATGATVGLSSSEGAWVNGELLEAGDMSGPSGARQVIGDPRAEYAVVETARGGILLKGVGWRSCDVAVVTNISADHLGLHGIHTVEELAAVKSLIVTLTGETGTSVLNADDPLVLGMRRRAAGKVTLFSLNPASAGVRAHLGKGGAAIGVEDGRILWYHDGEEVEILPVSEVPLALNGVARHNVQNALAASAAVLSLGIPLADVRAGLRTFGNSPEQNVGRLNIFDVPGGKVIVDYAHNEAGLRALLEVARSLAAGRVVAVIGSAGDRSDEILKALGRIAAEQADVIHIKGNPKYLRGRQSVEQVLEVIEEGIKQAPNPPPYDRSPTESTAVQLALSQIQAGDVIAVMCVEERDQIVSLLHQLQAGG